MKQFTRVRPAEGLAFRASAQAQRTAQALTDSATRLDRIHVLAGVLALGLTAYLAIEPTENWLLLLLTGLAAVSAMAIVHNHPNANFERVDDSALYLFVPVLFTLSVGIFLEEVSSGYLATVLGIASAPVFWVILWAEYHSLDRTRERYPVTRLALNLITYVIAFLFFATIYDFELDLLTASFAAGVVSVLLAIEVLREEGMDTGRTILYSGAIGLMLAEAAWATHFLPLEGSAAAVFLLLAFYLMTGLMHQYLAGNLNRKTAVEFSGVAVGGLAIIVLSNAYY